MTTPTTPAADAVREAVARAIWNVRREHEDRCDMELEDMGSDHPVWDEADAAILVATARESALVAERVALRAVATELLAACQVAFDQTCSVGRPKDWHQINAAINKARDCAALSATAVEGV